MNEIIAYEVSMADSERRNCVVHLVGNGDLGHDCLDHQVAGYHEADGVPTSEPCPGIDDCLDCQEILEQVVDA